MGISLRTWGIPRAEIKITGDEDINKACLQIEKKSRFPVVTNECVKHVKNQL